MILHEFVAASDHSHLAIVEGRVYQGDPAGDGTVAILLPICKAPVLVRRHDSFGIYLFDHIAGDKGFEVLQMLAEPRYGDAPYLVSDLAAHILVSIVHADVETESVFIFEMF